MTLYPIITSSVSQGKIAVNSLKNRIIYASLAFPGVEVYDEELNKIKVMNGPDPLPRSFSVKASGDLAFKGGIPVSYRSFCCNEDYIWLLYVGKFFPRGTLDKQLHKTPSYIFKFDWDGNFISSLSLDTYVSPISLGSDGETLYAMTYDQNDLPVPVKLVLK